MISLHSLNRSGRVWKHWKKMPIFADKMLEKQCIVMPLLINITKKILPKNNSASIKTRKSRGGTHI
jgi:hypothetical protein